MACLSHVHQLQNPESHIDTAQRVASARAHWKHSAERSESRGCVDKPECVPGLFTRAMSERMQSSLHCASREK